MRLGDIVKIKTGKLNANAASPDGKYPFFTCAKEISRISTYSYDCECVLVAGNGDLNVKYYKGKFDAYQRTYIIEDNSNGKLLMTYLYFFLDKYVETLREKSIGGVIKYIKLENLTEANIPLPSIDKQQDIVNCLSIVNNIKSKCNQELSKLDELVKSRFVEMFGDPIINERNWSVFALGDCLQTIECGKSFVCDSNSRTDDNPGLLKLSAATYGIYKPEENKAIRSEKEFVEQAEVHAGDLLFTRKNTPELVGMCAYVWQTPRKLMMPDLIFRLIPTDKVHPIFLWKLINHDIFRGKIQDIATGSAKSMSNISQERLRGLIIIVPPIALQNQFADFVQLADKSKLVAKALLAKCEILREKLMQDYFC